MSCLMEELCTLSYLPIQFILISVFLGAIHRNQGGATPQHSLQSYLAVCQKDYTYNGDSLVEFHYGTTKEDARTRCWPQALLTTTYL